MLTVALGRAAVHINIFTVQAMTGKKFSVLLPTRDRLELAKDAIETVRRQSFSDWELIVADNCSCDNVPEYVASLSDPRMGFGRIPVSSANRVPKPPARMTHFILRTFYRDVYVFLVSPSPNTIEKKRNNWI